MHKNILDAQYDVVIFGGGMCGISAASALVSAGKKVLIVERRPQLGWEITSAFQSEFKENESRVTKLFRKELTQRGWIKGNRVSPPIIELFLNFFVERYKIDVLLYSYPLQLIIKDGLVSGALIGNKGGEQVVRAKFFVDATNEALLWQQTSLDFIKVGSPASKYALFFNGVEEKINFPLNLGESAGVKNISVISSLWEKEAGIEFELPNRSITSARLKIPEVISYLRENIPQLKDAIVTHSAFEPFPLEVKAHLKKKDLRHPQIENLFGAGTWTIPDEDERRKANAVGSRIKIGEETGIFAINAFSTFKKRIPKPPGNFRASLIAAKHDSDVVVAGGGTAGAIAAIAAGRQGAKVMLLEANTMLGGITTGGGIHIYYCGTSGGLQDELDERTAEITHLFSGKYKAQGFHPEVRKLVLEQMGKEAGVKVIYESTAVGVDISKKQIKGIFTAEPEGKMLYSAKTFIDSTGDADVAIMAGAPFTIGRETDELPHAYGQSAGHLDKDGNMEVVNFDAGYVDAFDVVDLTRARKRGVHHYWRDSFDTQNRPIYIAPIIGIRQSRQIIGDYQLTLEDEILARRFEDCLGFMTSHYDNHFSDIENQNDEAMLWVWLLGNWARKIGCEIPYRCLLPKKVEGLLVACRALSVTIEAHYGLRMQPDMQRIGEFAGIAAALCTKLGTTPRKLDVNLVQEELRKSGALDDKYRPKPAITERPLKELKEMLVSDNPKDAVWLLAHGGKKAMPVLKEALKSGPQNSRFWAAAALAMHRQKDALPELLACVSEKRNIVPEGRKTVPLWQSSIVLLGRIGDSRAIPVLLEILSDRNVNLDTLIATVRALGRIGDKKAAPGLLKFLRRKDIPRIRQFQISCSAIANPVQEDALWQIELATAEVLAKLGKPQVKIIKKYLNDFCSYVRRYARKIDASSVLMLK